MYSSKVGTLAPLVVGQAENVILPRFWYVQLVTGVPEPLPDLFASATVIPFGQTPVTTPVCHSLVPVSRANIPHTTGILTRPIASIALTLLS